MPWLQRGLWIIAMRSNLDTTQMPQDFKLNSILSLHAKTPQQSHLRWLLIARLDHRLCDVEGISTILGEDGISGRVTTRWGDETEGVVVDQEQQALALVLDLFFSTDWQFSTGSSTCLGDCRGLVHKRCSEAHCSGGGKEWQWHGKTGKAHSSKFSSIANDGVLVSGL